MKKPVRVSTEYGPFELELIYCDNNDCTQRGVEQYLVNWIKVSKIGVEAAVFSDFMLNPEDKHFCSLTCLKAMTDREVR